MSVSAVRLPLAAPRVRRLVRGVIAGERRRRPVEVSVVFISRPGIRRLHRTWKRRDTPTDVLSFALPAPDGRVMGEIYICPGVARQQARAFGVSAAEELARLVIHGTLHVLGYDHPEGPGRMRSPMWRRQERYLGVLG